MIILNIIINITKRCLDPTIAFPRVPFVGRSCDYMSDRRYKVTDDNHIIHHNIQKPL